MSAYHENVTIQFIVIDNKRKSAIMCKRKRLNVAAMAYIKPFYPLQFCISVRS